MIPYPDRPRFEIDATPALVRAWSDFRLPFEPKGTALQFRDELRTALRGLRRDAVLHATYTSMVNSRCDVENIAIYNVGYSAVRGCGTRGVTVERRQAPVPSAPSGATFPHVLEYRAGSGDVRWENWKRRATLITWPGTSVQQVSGTTSASEIWRSLKAATAHVKQPWDGTRPLGVIVRVDACVELVPLMKASVDGAVAAAHVHDGTDLDTVASRLAANLNVDPVQTAAWLSDSRAAVLGARRLVHLRGGGVQWNPADDQVVAITMEHGGSGFEVEICTVESR